MTEVTINSDAILASSRNLSGIFGSKVGNLVIGNDVKSIGDYAFNGCSGLTSVTIPSSVMSIGADAFSGCSNLKEIAIYSNVIMSKSFDYEESLRGNNFFKIFGKQVEKLIVGEGVKSIGDYAFYRCTNLSSIIIPNSVTSIGTYAFHDTKWYENQPDGLIYAGSVAYNYKGTMPSGTSVILKEGTTGITRTAFYNCSGLSSVTIPNSVTSIGSYAFYNCSNLSSVTIPNSVTSIERNTFQNCTSLTSVYIPNSVTTIGEDAFSGCSGLTSVTIPNSVTYIGQWAFRKCTGLTSVTIPYSVTCIGEYNQEIKGETNVEIISVIA